jgi:hypothetical protein
VRPIGEILLEHGWVERANLDRALASQRPAGRRLCSMLIARGELDPDHAARALGEQHGVAAVLQKHLEHRDRTLVKLLSSDLARSSCALPIGRMRDDALIVCARDPSPELRAALAKALPQETLVLAVAPAQQLEALVAQSYDDDDDGHDEFEVDLTTGPISVLPPGAGLADLGAMTLVELDDRRVAKDPSQSGTFTAAGKPAPPALPRTASRNMAPSMPRTITSPPRALETPMTLPDTLAALARATTADEATTLAMKYAAGRWLASILLVIKEGAALGHRAHGAQLARDSVLAIVIPLTAPSIVQAAHDTRTLVTDRPPTGEIEDRLEHLLGQPRFPAAVAVSIDTQVGCVLVTGDPIAGDPDAAAADLDRMATALGEVYTRIMREAKKS